MAVREVYSSYLLDKNDNPSYFRVFDVDDPPRLALDPGRNPALPTFGDLFPDDNTLFVDSQKVIDRLAPSLTRVAVRYSRTTFEGVNIYRTDSSGAGPFIVTEYSSLSETIAVPRYVNIQKDVGGVIQTVEWQTRTQNHPISSTLITKTTHRETWTQADERIASSQVGVLHSDLGGPSTVSEFDSQARFLGFSARQIGLRLWRIEYRWKLAYPYGPFLAEPVTPGVPGLDFTASKIAVFNAQSGDGSFPPHSNVDPVISSFSTIANVGTTSAPLYVADLIYTRVNVSTVLPGLT